MSEADLLDFGQNSKIKNGHWLHISKKPSRLSEIAPGLVRLDHVATIIVNADDGIM